ncbi:MAG: GAF domain-containing protein [Chloroflexi bacterium]|nr:GAF domain-containing protein [Chloroflexota bacterium]
MTMPEQRVPGPQDAEHAGSFDRYSYDQLFAYAHDLRTLYREEAALRRELERRVAELDAFQQQLRQQVNDLLALHEVGLAINSARDFHEMFDHIAQSLVYTTRANHCVLYLWNQTLQAFDSQVGFGIYRERTEDVALRESALSRFILERAEPIEVTDAAVPGHPIYQPALDRGWRAFLGVPMNSRGVRVGVLYAGYREPHIFDDRERQLTRLVAEISAVALHRWQLLEPE